MRDELASAFANNLGSLNELGVSRGYKHLANVGNFIFFFFLEDLTSLRGYDRSRRRVIVAIVDKGRSRVHAIGAPYAFRCLFTFSRRNVTRGHTNERVPVGFFRIVVELTSEDPRNVARRTNLRADTVQEETAARKEGLAFFHYDGAVNELLFSKRTAARVSFYH